MKRRTGRRSPRSLAVSEGFKAFVLDQLADLDVTPKSMFGGLGLYARGVFFGILARHDTLYLKVDDINRPDYEAIGAKPFQPYRDRPVTMRYYPVPVSVIESAPEVVAWAKKAIAAAERSGSRSTPSTGRRS